MTSRDGHDDDDRDVLDAELRASRLAEGWAQGHVLTGESVAEFLVPRARDDDASVVVVATQTCDLLLPSLRIEPSVELLLGTLVEGDAPNDIGKSFRSFYLALDDGPSAYASVVLNSRRFVNRAAFIAQAKPTQRQPTIRTRTSFANWLAQRYARPAYPDNLIARLDSSGGGKKVERAMKKLTSCTGVYLVLNTWSESPPADGYRVVIVILLRSECSFDDRKNAALALSNITQAFHASGISVDEVTSRIETEDNLSLADFRTLSKWHLDYLTLRDTTGTHAEPVPPGS